MDKRTIRKLSINELEVAYSELAIDSIDQMLTSTAKSHNRKVDLLYTIGEELKNRGPDGIDAIDRLAESDDARTRFCICGTLKSMNMNRTIAILESIATVSDSLVANLAASTIKALEIMRPPEA